ncbi:MAG: hypothetical protein CVU56_03175 [Deltaproteobacteria bacterium HGW-Deltaproteobacteria-14]|nr:MAG: hypothetical protein CVU56_03175 [Deltaproteobacteria bacterium HGW-Deltaproteobacteria-14]
MFRTLYREVREIIGLKPPPENGTQLAERLCGELKNELGGKKGKDGDNYTLDTVVGERETTLLFEAEPSRACVAMVVAIDEGISWTVSRDPLGGAEAPDAGVERIYVATGLYVEGTGRAVAQAEAAWKQLPTGARGVISQLVGKAGGQLEVDGAVVRYTPELETLLDKSARYTVKNHLQAIQKVIEGMESGWA